MGVFLQFDEETEALCAELGMDVWFPEASLRARCDSKVETVRLGNRAGVPSVPNVLGRVRGYRQLRRLASAAGLRGDLVVQLPYGDSGHTTFFISNRDDFEHHARAIAAESEVKVMKRIDAAGRHPRSLRDALWHDRRAAAHRAASATPSSRLTPAAGPATSCSRGRSAPSSARPLVSTPSAWARSS